MKKYLSILFLFSVVFICASSAANAAKIPTCDDKKVLRWIENIFFEKWWTVPRDKVSFQMEFLTETFSQPNERGCEVTLRSKLSPSAIKEMNGYLETWNKETENSRPPSWLLNFSSEAVNKINFSLKYDLIKKDWFGQYGSPVPNTNTPLGKYRTALKGELIVAIQREKDRVSREKERIQREEKSRIQREEKNRIQEENDRFTREKERIGSENRGSAAYAGRLRARIRPNIKFSDDISINTGAEVELRAEPDGRISSSKLIKSSGSKAWDDAVLKAIEDTATLPRDHDGKVPPLLLITFKPRE